MIMGTIYSSKRELLSTLNNVKLIIGNGFDLYCGLKTKYSDYFNSLEIVNEIKDIIEILYSNTNNQDYYIDELLKHRNLLFYSLKSKNYNIWIVYFYLNSNISKDNIRWCDIEKIIQKSFIYKEKLSNNTTPKCFWEYVYSCLFNSNDFSYYTYNIKLCSMFLLERFKDKIVSYNKFLTYLLSQLIEFEKEFGNYVNSQTLNSNYITNVERLIREKLYLNNNICIDSFNYSSFEFNDVIINHINGDWEKPIFGINITDIDVNDYVSLFSKSARRLLNNCDDKIVYDSKNINNIVIFGHSLNEQDYGYYFDLFDKISLNDEYFNGKIIFAYYIYNVDIKLSIKMKLVYDIQTLFNAYLKYKGIMEERFLEKLQLRKQILLYEVDSQ